MNSKHEFTNIRQSGTNFSDSKRTVKYEVLHLGTEPRIPNNVKRQLRKVKQSMMSKAANRSSNTNSLGLTRINQLHFL